MINKVIVNGRLTRDPEIRYTPNGVAVANFTVASNRPFSNQEGNREADFIPVVAWRKLAENISNYVKKGDRIAISGRLQSRQYEDNNGNRVFRLEVVADEADFLETKNKSNSNANNQTSNNRPSDNGRTNDGGYRGAGNRTYDNQSESGFGGNGFSATDDDPFKDSGEPIDISDDDLPF